MDWNVGNDAFVFRFKEIVEKAKNLIPTKRCLFKLGASLYDPIGLISPVTTKIKILFQLLCNDKLGWDDWIPNDIEIIWNELLHEI